MVRDVSSQLRRAVTDLAGLELEDLRAILNELDEGERDQTESLLREFAELGSEPRTVLAETLAHAHDWVGARILAGLSADERKRETTALAFHDRHRLLALAEPLRVTPLASRTLLELAADATGGQPLVSSRS